MCHHYAIRYSLQVVGFWQCSQPGPAGLWWWLWRGHSSPCHCQASTVDTWSYCSPWRWWAWLLWVVSPATSCARSPPQYWVVVLCVGRGEIDKWKTVMKHLTIAMIVKARTQQLMCIITVLCVQLCSSETWNWYLEKQWTCFAWQNPAEERITTIKGNMINIHS